MHDVPLFSMILRAGGGVVLGCYDQLGRGHALTEASPPFVKSGLFADPLGIGRPEGLEVVSVLRLRQFGILGVTPRQGSRRVTFLFLFLFSSVLFCSRGNFRESPGTSRKFWDTILRRFGRWRVLAGRPLMQPRLVQFPGWELDEQLVRYRIPDDQPGLVHLPEAVAYILHRDVIPHGHHLGFYPTRRTGEAAEIVGVGERPGIEQGRLKAQAVDLLRQADLLLQDASRCHNRLPPPVRQVG